MHVRRLENDEDLEVVDDDEDEIDEDGNENVARLQHESNSPLFQTLNTSEQGVDGVISVILSGVSLRWSQSEINNELLILVTSNTISNLWLEWSRVG